MTQDPICHGCSFYETPSTKSVRTAPKNQFEIIIHVVCRYYLNKAFKQTMNEQILVETLNFFTPGLANAQSRPVEFRVSGKAPQTGSV